MSNPTNIYVMKGFNSVLAMVSALVLMSGCSAAYYSAVNAGDGMYGVHDKIAIAKQQQQRAELQRAEAEARRAEWEAKLAEAQAKAAQEEYLANANYSTIVADSYESASTTLRARSPWPTAWKTRMPLPSRLPRRRPKATMCSSLSRHSPLAC